jgi:hypothetical protein
MTVSYEWRGGFTSAEANALHAECFGHPVLGDDEWDWRGQVEDHLRGFYFDACGFTPTNAGLMEL